MDAFTQVCPNATSEGRTLRRRRSAASAALLSRPSMLTLGELVPCFETCVLVYACSIPVGTDAAQQPSRLIYALFEPNFLVDGTSRTIRKLDRTSWERLRSHVEELRIVALSSRYGDESISEPNSPISATRSRKPDCIFDLSTPTDSLTHRSVARIYLQPKSYTSIPARCKEELLEIEIHGPADAMQAEQRWICLPTQVRAVLQDAEQIMTAPTTPKSAPLKMDERQSVGDQSETDHGSTCERILQLIQGNSATS
ncbi:uncharacterized protein UTRI_10596_B [Ustilago trichophora]|uniref:Uncharacterized protein n=1 Tax=Ustilago trichophora TaxID=86804 RepID=A0A5C3EAR6_9BASI|nr:uncharacterized protein UTRI_10596_B [Ustilago trichophora]